MALPIFGAGQEVSFAREQLFIAPGAFKVIKALYSDNGPTQYRIKSDDEAFDRIADESSLRAMAAFPT